MTDAELAAEAWDELTKTTDSYVSWKRKGFPSTSHWAHAKGILDTIGVSQPPVPPPTPTPGGNPVPPPTSGAWFAAFVEGRDTYNHYYPGQHPGGGTWDNAPWDTESWDRYEQNAGKKLWGLCNGDGSAWNGGFDDLKYIMQANVARGTVPVLDSDPSKLGTLAEFTAGSHDASIDAYAQVMKAFGKPIVLRPWCEMNGSWYRYAQEAHLNPPVFVSAWQRVVSRFRAAGATNVAFHWCPNVDPERPARYTPLEQMYPGDTYVDWTGLTGYQHAANELCDWVFGSTYSRVVALAPGKPIMIGEVAASDQNNGGSTAAKTQFIRDLFTNVAPGGKWQQVKAVCWFNWYIYENSVYWDWPIESTPQTLTAFRAAVSSSAVVGR